MEECSRLHALVDKLLEKEFPRPNEFREGGIGPKASLNSLETKKISSSSNQTTIPHLSIQ